MSDRVIILNNGRVEEVNETDRLFLEPNEDYTKKLLFANDF
jgi:ABC-type microcin C transport system duplicated ATPase subunit YejF